MSDIYYCPSCKRYAEQEYIRTIKGSSEYAGGPPLEPDEEIYVCAYCGNTADDMVEDCDLEMAVLYNNLVDENDMLNTKIKLLRKLVDGAKSLIFVAGAMTNDEKTKEDCVNWIKEAQA